MSPNNNKAPLELVQEVARTGRLPVVNFAAGGVATPADAALMMQLGMDGVFVGSGIFKSGNPAERAAAIVKATLLLGRSLNIPVLAEGVAGGFSSVYGELRLMDERGRGLGFIELLMDDVTIDPSPEGTVIRFAKRLGD